MPAGPESPAWQGGSLFPLPGFFACVLCLCLLPSVCVWVVVRPQFLGALRITVEVSQPL